MNDGNDSRQPKFLKTDLLNDTPFHENVKSRSFTLLEYNACHNFSILTSTNIYTTNTLHLLSHRTGLPSSVSEL